MKISSQHPLLLKKARKNTLFGILLLLFAFCCLSGCTAADAKGSTTGKISGTDFLLNTVITIYLYDSADEDILKGCFQLIKKYEDIYSRTLSTSELYALNHRILQSSNGKYRLSEELSDLLSYGLYYSKLSKGAFDITIEPISSLWDFTSDPPALPSKAAIEGQLPNVSYEYIHLDGREISFAKEGVRIDLGAIAKGYIADRVKDYLTGRGVHSAIINLGGNILCVGTKPDGAPFQVGIQKPFAPQNEAMAVLEISDYSVVSSGTYEKYLKKDGKLYHHLLNTKTGYPYDNDILSVTIISPKSVDGDGLSTTCFALGVEKGLELISRLPDTYAVYITKDYKLHYSPGMEGNVCPPGTQK
ncbi:MAG TPA: FAD:protein FMN transferase [Clostridiales bacterium]|nr:FAD:protein FMN transferase [Clostridiales bacterium]